MGAAVFFSEGEKVSSRDFLTGFQHTTMVVSVF